MSPNCNDVCLSHSGVCQNIDNLAHQIDNLNKELHEQKGYASGMFNSQNNEIKEVNQKLRDEMK